MHCTCAFNRIFMNVLSVRNVHRHQVVFFFFFWPGIEIYKSYYHYHQHYPSPPPLLSLSSFKKKRKKRRRNLSTHYVLERKQGRQYKGEFEPNLRRCVDLTQQSNKKKLKNSFLIVMSRHVFLQGFVWRNTFEMKSLCFRRRSVFGMPDSPHRIRPYWLARSSGSEAQMLFLSAVV